MRKFNWGILGCSTIAPAFIDGLRHEKNANILAVASRELVRAEKFSQEHNIPTFYGSYEELVENPDVDIIYISTTNNLHKDNIILCLNAGKHVLCEKPLTMNAKDTKEVIDIAQKKKLFLMEGLWTTFLPTFVKLRELLDSGIIGNVKMIRADFGFYGSWGKERRLLNPDLGGGTLMDNGIYPIFLSFMIFGQKPSVIETVSQRGETGVDEYSCYLFKYSSGEIATLSSTISLLTPQDAFIIGEKGYIELPEFWHGEKIIIRMNNGDMKEFSLPFKSSGFQYEAREVMKCIGQEKLQSDFIPHQLSLEIAETMEQIASQLV